jgi:hypothetical protein
MSLGDHSKTRPDRAADNTLKRLYLKVDDPGAACAGAGSFTSSSFPYATRPLPPPAC